MNSLLQRSKTLGKNSFKQRDVSDTYFSSYPEQTQLLDVALFLSCQHRTMKSSSASSVAPAAKAKSKSRAKAKAKSTSKPKGAKVEQ